MKNAELSKYIYISIYMMQMHNVYIEKDIGKYSKIDIIRFFLFLKNNVILYYFVINVYKLVFKAQL